MSHPTPRRRPRAFSLYWKRSDRATRRRIDEANCVDRNPNSPGFWSATPKLYCHYAWYVNSLPNLSSPKCPITLSSSAHRDTWGALRYGSVRNHPVAGNPERVEAPEAPGIGWHQLRGKVMDCRPNVQWFKVTSMVDSDIDTLCFRGDFSTDIGAIDAQREVEKLMSMPLSLHHRTKPKLNAHGRSSRIWRAILHWGAGERGRANFERAACGDVRLIQLSRL